MKKRPKCKSTKQPAKLTFALVMQFEETGQLTVPRCLQMGSDGKLYLTRSVGPTGTREKPQPISLKESVAWFRLGHEYNLPLKKGDAFGQWLSMIERALA